VVAKPLAVKSLGRFRATNQVNQYCSRALRSQYCNCAVSKHTPGHKRDPGWSATARATLYTGDRPRSGHSPTGQICGRSPTPSRRKCDPPARVHGARSTTRTTGPQGVDAALTRHRLFGGSRGPKTGQSPGSTKARWRARSRPGMSLPCGPAEGPTRPAPPKLPRVYRRHLGMTVLGSTVIASAGARTPASTLSPAPWRAHPDRPALTGRYGRRSAPRPPRPRG
jgi:hypothetical protein